jgi:hypothetical protein
MTIIDEIKIKAQKEITVSDLENKIIETETLANNLADELLGLKKRLMKYDIILQSLNTARGKWRIS